MAVLENIFSWSKSRDEEFRECQRRYYYARYLSWGGWDRKAPPRVRQAYIFKNLKNRWAWKGEIVHHIIEDVLKSLRFGRPVMLQEALKRLTETMRLNYRSSKGKKYLEDPKNNLGLFEHEYDKPVTDEMWKRIHDEAADCMNHFYDSAFYRELAEDDKKSWLLIEDLEEFDFNGAKIYVKLDFARKKKDNVEIVDWKTGRTDPEADIQIGAYAMYAMAKWSLPLKNVRAFLMNISQPGAVLREQFVTESLMDLTRQTMTKSIEAMRQFMTDPVKNSPKPEEEFAFTDNERSCDFCAYRKICKKFYPSA